MTRDVVVTSTDKPFEQSVALGPHRLVADEPSAFGGMDVGPNPYDLLLAALGTCTSMTLNLYARRKQWPLERVVVRLRHQRLHVEDCDRESDPGCRLERIERAITLLGAGLTAAQRERLLEIADHCPVHKTLTGKLEIKTQLVDA
jgi:putative redox protein